MSVLRFLRLTAVLVLIMSAFPIAALAAGGTSYVVRPGDTLAAIAAANGSTMQALIDANGLTDPDLIWVGQELLIPRARGVATEKPTAPSAYIVKPGQTLSQIAALWGVDLATIIQANDLSNPDRIYAGMTLFIPGTADGARGAADLQGTRFIASISGQRCWLYQNGTLIGNWRCSTGRQESPTIPGSYKVQSKINPAYASAWDFWMPYWMGLYYAGRIENGIHGLPYAPKTGRRTWEGLVGTPITYGCIMLDDANAKTLFDVAYIGMPVVILP